MLAPGLSEDDHVKIFLIANRKLESEIIKIKDDAKNLLNKGFTQEEVCNQFFSKELSKNGCKAMGTIDHADIKEMIIALKQKDLDEIFNDENNAE